MVDSALKIIRNRKYLLILIATCLIMHFCALADLLLQANVSMNLINIFMINYICLFDYLFISS